MAQSTKCKKCGLPIIRLRGEKFGKEHAGLCFHCIVGIPPAPKKKRG